MNPILLDIYDIFRKNSGKSIKTINQYNPHRGFCQSTALQKFESEFPKLIFENDLNTLSTQIRQARNDINALGPSLKSYKTYCTAFLDFLDNIINNNKSNKDLLKQLQSAYHIDGNQALVDVLGGEKNFIKKAIQESYFFDPKLVDSRLEEIIKLYKDNKPIPARWQGVRVSGIRPQCGYDFCDIDTNGNAKVRSVINAKTGYTVSAGNTNFINYKISHIWGNAMNPRFYTNLWNIVLIPAWANDLLDKVNPLKGSLSSQIRNTYMAICDQLYGLHNGKLQALALNLKDVDYDKNEVAHGTYDYKSIDAKPANSTKGHIQINQIKI